MAFERDLLSKSDMECLDNSIKRYVGLSFNELTELSDDNAWNYTNQNESIEIDHIIADFKNSKDISEHLQNPHP